MKSKSELKMRMLKAHNAIRKIYGLPNMVWSPKLAETAQKWANQLKSKHKCKLIHSSKRIYGENLAMNWTSKTLSKSQFDKSPEYAVQDWAKECKNYLHVSHKCKAGKVCGHFTQVVWEDSEKVGCGMVTCDGKENPYGQGRLELWVCNYSPPGNYIGEKPF